MRNLTGKTAIVTGAAGGIGGEVARLFDRHGIKLVLTDINADGLTQTARGLTREPLCLPCDITTPEEVRAMVAAALKHYGAVDILVNNAGIIVPGLFEHSTYADIERQVRINLLGAVTCTREVIPVMRQGGAGHIVTVSSMAGLVPETYSAIYTATKFALRGFNLTLAIELKKHRIGVSTIFPDSVATPMLRYEAEHGGSPLTFLSPPQSPALVAEEILGAIVKNKVEVYVPASTGMVSKAVMCWPWAVTRIWPLLEYLGRRKQPALASQLRRSLPE
jgi:hypothetical protein